MNPQGIHRCSLATEARVDSGSNLGDGAALFRDITASPPPLPLPPWGKGLIKLPSSLPASIPQLAGHPSCGRTIKNKTKVNTDRKAWRTMQIGAWNARSLMDTNNSRRPECMTAIFGHELLKYNIDTAALSKTRLAGTGDLTEAESGHTFF